MRKLVLATVALAVLLGFSGCASSNKTSKKSYPKIENINSIKYLTQKEVKDLYTGHTSYGKNLRTGTNIEISYLSDGTYKGTVSNGKINISGEWFVKKDGTKCSNKAFCTKLYKENDHYVGTRDGKKIFNIKFK